MCAQVTVKSNSKLNPQFLFTINKLVGLDARVFMVGGGGCGGKGIVGGPIQTWGGGGSGGQVRDTVRELLFTGTYPVVVGLGATNPGSPTYVSTIAGDTTFDGLVCIGGGNGGGWDVYEPPTSGAYGGGGGWQTGMPLPKIGAIGLVAFKGGDGLGPSSDQASGGGGGASQNGFNATVGPPYGQGGDGLFTDITGVSEAYGAGGGGGAYQLEGAGGSAGVGGRGAKTSAIIAGGNAMANRGSGGGGGSPSFFVPGFGSNGRVIIRYAGPAIFSGGIISSFGGDTIHIFNASGNLTPL